MNKKRNKISLTQIIDFVTQTSNSTVLEYTSKLCFYIDLTVLIQKKENSAFRYISTTRNEVEILLIKKFFMYLVCPI